MRRFDIVKESGSGPGSCIQDSRPDPIIIPRKFSISGKLIATKSNSDPTYLHDFSGLDRQRIHLKNR